MNQNQTPCFEGNVYPRQLSLEISYKKTVASVGKQDGCQWIHSKCLLWLLESCSYWFSNKTMNCIVCSNRKHYFSSETSEQYLNVTFILSYFFSSHCWSQALTEEILTMDKWWYKVHCPHAHGMVQKQYAVMEDCELQLESR